MACTYFVVKNLYPWSGKLVPSKNLFFVDGSKVVVAFSNNEGSVLFERTFESLNDGRHEVASPAIARNFDHYHNHANLTYSLNPIATMQELTGHTLVGASGNEIDTLLTTAGHLTPWGVRVTGQRCNQQGELFHSGGNKVRHMITQNHHRPPDTQCDVVTSSTLGVAADTSVSAGNVGQGGVIHDAICR